MLIRCTISSALASLAFVCTAFAGGEDFQTFVADCSGLNSDTQTYSKGTRCTVKLNQSPCIRYYQYLPKGFDVYVARRTGRTWTKVTPTTHYEACAPESENGKNKSMTFRVSTTSTYAIFVDGKNDGKPAFRGSVLAPFSLNDSSSFKVPVK